MLICVKIRGCRNVLPREKKVWHNQLNPFKKSCRAGSIDTQNAWVYSQTPPTPRDNMISVSVRNCNRNVILNWYNIIKENLYDTSLWLITYCFLYISERRMSLRINPGIPSIYGSSCTWFFERILLVLSYFFIPGQNISTPADFDTN